jgi:hypothetical protein
METQERILLHSDFIFSNTKTLVFIEKMINLQVIFIYLFVVKLAPDGTFIIKVVDIIGPYIYIICIFWTMNHFCEE